MIKYLFLLAVLLCLSCSQQNNQVANQSQDKCAGVSIFEAGDVFVASFNGDIMQHPHEAVANCFAWQVGLKLKANYPSRVLDPNVRLLTYRDDTRRMFQLSYSTRITRATPETADYYFEHAGTLLSGADLSEARKNVNTQIARSNKVEFLRRRFKEHYGSSNMPDSFIVESFSGSNTEREFWYIKEYFITAPKEPGGNSVSVNR